MSLFNKDITPACEYCRHGIRIAEDEVLCKKQGVSSPWDACPKFRYAPLKRVPERPRMSRKPILTREDAQL